MAGLRHSAFVCTLLIVGCASVNAPRADSSRGSETAAAPPGAVPSAVAEAPVLAEWAPHHVEFSYFGITTLYTCDGLESQVKRILLQLGARPDARVRASGCPGIDLPSRTAWVDADFHTLVPTTDATARDTIKARWTPKLLQAQRPNFLGYGDCELVSEMRGLISQNFSTRGLDYSAHCFPHVENPDDYQIKADVLQALPAKAG
jgi:hypothetical protein